MCIRDRLYIWLEQLKKYIKKSIILVTHDIDEAIFLSDKVIVMGSGKNNFRFQKDISMPHPRGSNINMSSHCLFPSVLQVHVAFHHEWHMIS